MVGGVHNECDYVYWTLRIWAQWRGFPWGLVFLFSGTACWFHSGPSYFWSGVLLDFIRGVSFIIGGYSWFLWGRYLS